MSKMRKMKDSGIEWIGEIPEEWNITRVKYAFIRKNDKAQQEKPVILSLARDGVRIRDVSTNEGQVAESYYNYNPVAAGDLLLNPMDLYSGANCSLSEVNGVISPAYINLRNKSGYNSKFYDYYFKVLYWMMVLFSYGKGVSFDNRWTLNHETLMNLPVIAPSLIVQSRIADYLDDKCGKIDRYIETQRKIIEKLKAYKQAVITESVTKGLDPTVPMKDSGNREVGFIPTHWKLGKLLYFSNKIGDGLHGTPEYDDNGDCYFINGNNLGQNELVIKGDTKSVSDKEWKKYYIKLTDKTLLISLNGTIGNVTPYHNEKVILGKSAGYIILNDSVDISYIQYYLQSKTTYNIFELSFSGTTIKNLSLETLRNLPICIMPIVEQKQIASYLKKVCDNINSSIFRKQRLIDKLTEYKKSLIYEAVTGKQEVF